MAESLLKQDEDVQGSALKKRKVETSSENLSRFQTMPLASNIDYITLQSSLDLLRARAADLERNIHELANFKQSVKESSDLKQVASLIHNKSSYLDEISYKGVAIKCPSIEWNRNIGLNLEKLEEDGSYEKINDEYEIIKRDQLF